MPTNSFKDLEKLNRERFVEKEDIVKRKITGSYGLMKFVGNMFEVFLPSIFRMFSGFSGNENNRHTNGAPSPQKPDTTNSAASSYPNKKEE